MAVSGLSSAVDALVFDAYGTLFDVHAVIARAEEMVPGHGATLSRLWRTKQLEYTWLQSLMGPAVRENFEVVTAHALDYAVAELGLSLTMGERCDLRDAYLTLAPFPDVRGSLEALAPRPRWILSNGTLAMLEPLVRHHGLDALLDGILSVEEAGIYKPSPRVYQLARRPPRPAGGANRIRVVEWLGRDRRQGLRLRLVLDQPHGCAGRSSRSGARPDHRHACPICRRCSEKVGSDPTFDYWLMAPSRPPT